MSVIIASRISVPAYKVANTSLSPIARGVSTSTTASSSGAPGFWKRLTPTTRRNVKIGAGLCFVTDAFVLYKWPGVFGLQSE